MSRFRCSGSSNLVVGDKIWARLAEQKQQLLAQRSFPPSVNEHLSDAKTG